MARALSAATPVAVATVVALARWGPIMGQTPEFFQATTALAVAADAL